MKTNLMNKCGNEYYDIMNRTWWSFSLFLSVPLLFPNTVSRETVVLLYISVETAGEDAHCGQQPTLISVGVFFSLFFVKLKEICPERGEKIKGLLYFLQTSCQNIPAMLRAQYATAKWGQNVCLKCFQDNKKEKEKKERGTGKKTVKSFTLRSIKAPDSAN